MSQVTEQASAFFAAQKQSVDRRLSELVPGAVCGYSSLFEAARYSLLGPGKRFRPLLALATVETLGGDLQAALTPVCCLEMIHAYSLIHDDLPCMDDDDIRRGVPTLHRAFSEPLAVLAGDFLLTLPFEVLSRESSLREDVRLELIALLASHAGADGMIGGQVIDILAEGGREVILQHVETMHRLKTGKLIAASIAFGAVLSGASREQRGLLEEFGELLGLIFQVHNDIIDDQPSRKGSGVALSSDRANQKATYVALLGRSGAQKRFQELQAEAKVLLGRLSLSTDLLASLLDSLVVE